ncbi:MAG: XisI protein [Saprospiraceae bacterium]|nr:XisI protein [Saprospiraceae bacterium]
MDKVKKYEQIILHLLNDYAGIRKSLTPNVISQVLVDRENQHYQLLSIGWHNGKFVYTMAFHFSIQNDKVWIQQNNTDAMIADELVERGVLRSDIVLGFVPEKVRGETGFAVA